ncbi:MAG: hypothetical protein ACI9W6_001509, partial [Motiliproteus sp.]
TKDAHKGVIIAANIVSRRIVNAMDKAAREVLEGGAPLCTITDDDVKAPQ